jgi:AcrR family transcriptional regulator
MGTTERRQREAHQRRDGILKAARKVFWKKGYQAATMPQIAAVAEIAPGTLYLYFPSKEVLYVELLIEGYIILHGQLEQAAAPRQSPVRQAQALIDGFFEFARTNPEYFDIIFFVLQQEKSKWQTCFPREQVDRLNRAEALCQHAVATVLERIVKRSTKRRKAVMNAVWSMLAGVVFFFRARGNYEETAKAARDLLLQAVSHGI